MDTPKELFNSTCSTNSESFALQNLGTMMTPEFSENCIVIIDPGMTVHHQAYAVIEYQDDLYFRQYIERDDKKYMVCLNSTYPEIELTDEFVVRGCVVQQKQRKQTALHYYHLDKQSKELKFSIYGKPKSKS